jgi:hypothetical protein
VFVRFGKILLIFLLLATLGAHWALLQTVAWTTMLTNNLQSGSFHDAMTKTFDGRHPCCLCKAIAAAKKSEKKSDAIAPGLKFEFPPTPDNPVLVAPAQFHFLPQADTFSESLTHPPLTPPPRAVPA